MNRNLTLGHSPDPDDAFMFYGLARGLVDGGGFTFTHVLQDIQTLNERAMRGELDISAISVHAYAYVSRLYALLPSGASMGDGYGPRIIAAQPWTREELRAKRIAIPGKLTSAFLALQLWLERPAAALDLVVVPFDQIFAALREGRADAGLIIHEGQLTFAHEQLVLCQDLGQWWGAENDGLPLPLGANVIHRRLSERDQATVAAVLEASIRYSLEHRTEAVRYALQFGRGLDLRLADEFIGMYVNHWTLDYGERGRESIRRFLQRAFRAGLIPEAPDLAFVNS